jgi:hypothetical protein
LKVGIQGGEAAALPEPAAAPISAICTETPARPLLWYPSRSRKGPRSTQTLPAENAAVEPGGGRAAALRRTRSPRSPRSSSPTARLDTYYVVFIQHFSPKPPLDCGVASSPPTRLSSCLLHHTPLSTTRHGTSFLVLARRQALLARSRPEDCFDQPVDHYEADPPPVPPSGRPVPHELTNLYNAGIWCASRRGHNWAGNLGCWGRSRQTTALSSPLYRLEYSLSSREREREKKHFSL